MKGPRKTHAKKDPLAAEIFKFTLPEHLAEMSVGAERVRLWVLDEHRYGRLPVIGRSWSLRGVRVHAPYATKYSWGYLHEAMEVDGDNRMELFFTPSVDQDTHALFLRQIAETVTRKPATSSLLTKPAFTSNPTISACLLTCVCCLLTAQS